MFEHSAGDDPAGFLAAVTEALAKLPSELWRTENDGFAAIAEAMDALAVQVDCARVGLVAEAQSRGVVTASCSSGPADWLMAHSFHLEPSDATRTAELARACAQPANQVLAAAVAGGTLTVRKAVTALRQLAQVEYALEPGKREEALGSLTLMAQSGYNANVVAVGRTLMSLVGADRSLERDENALRSLSSLRLSPMENGMLRVSGQLDPEAGAVLRAALDPLSAPQPCTPTPAGKRFDFAGTNPADNSDSTGTGAGFGGGSWTGSATGTGSGTGSESWSGSSGCDPRTGRDLRPPERRRADALIELCRRAAAAGGAAPATTKAQIVVTIDFDTLKDAVKGAGHTLDGTVLSPQTVRKLACDASITPMVLGSKSQPLDVGRTKRLVTPAQLAALYARDKGCTFPGCGRPAQWTNAHHVIHWIDGGTTCLLNLALACDYHHTWIHQHDLTATVTAFGVTWQP